ncbi:MAG: SLC13 family permease [Cardiobacteriaceae bacterium]|nr:SLC13 family permease [Cardiobacteriaceae bacterium]
MNWEMLFVFALLAVTVVVFVWDRFRMDMVAFAVMLTLALSGIVTPKEAVAGFSNSVLLMIAGLFVVGDGLMRTGVAALTGNWLLRVSGGSKRRTLLFLLPLVAILSGLMSSTGTVALLIPVILTMVRRTGQFASHLMMPMAFAALIGGMLTLIGTPPNLVVSEALQAGGYEPFSFFSFTPVGLIVLAVGMVYLLTVAQWLLPSKNYGENAAGRHTLSELAAQYNIERRLYKFVPRDDSPLIGKTVLDARLRRRYAATLFAVERQGRLLSSFVPVLINTTVQRADILWLYIEPEYAEKLMQDMALQSLPVDDNQLLRIQQAFGFAEVLVTPRSTLIGKSLQEADFRDRYGLSAIGVRRGDEVLYLDYQNTKLQASDALLLVGDWAQIRRLGNASKDLLVFNTPLELDDAPVHLDKAGWAIGIMSGLLLCMATGWLDNLTAILLAAFLMVATGCLSIREAYQSLNPMSLVLIACLLPMSTAMEKSGALAFVVQHIVAALQNAEPILIAAAFFLLTSLLSQFISNTATSVLMAPVAMSTALGLGFNPQPLLMMVAIAASSAFCTPIASPVNTLVLVPGSYRFMDYVKVGLGLQCVVMCVALLAVPLFFPY